MVVYDTRTTPGEKSRPWNGTRDSIEGATQRIEHTLRQDTSIVAHAEIRDAMEAAAS
jgi:hypothetical protein